MDLDNENEDNERTKRKKGSSGKGDNDGSFGDGKAGAGAGIGFLLSTKKNHQVKSDWHHLTAGDLINAVVEFFGELPLRASANLLVVWDKTKTNVKSFAIVNWAIDFGDKAVKEFVKNRDRIRGAGRDSRGLIRKKPGIVIKPGPAGPTTQ